MSYAELEELKKQLRGPHGERLHSNQVSHPMEHRSYLSRRRRAACACASTTGPSTRSPSRTATHYHASMSYWTSLEEPRSSAKLTYARDTIKSGFTRMICSKDRFPDLLQPLRVHSPTLRVDECTGHLPTIDERHLPTVPGQVRSHLIGRHPHLLQERGRARGPPSPSTGGPAATQTIRQGV